MDQLHGVQPPRKPFVQSVGGRVHEVLAGRPVGERVGRLYMLLEPYRVDSKFRRGRYFHRIWRDFDVYGDVDDLDFDLDDHVRVIEWKTIRAPDKLKGFYYSAPYRFQVQLYCWMLEPPLQALGFQLSPTHLIEWFDPISMGDAVCPTCERPVEPTSVQYSQSRVEADLERIHEAYYDPSKIIYPHFKEKCKRCDAVYREKCPKGNVVLAS